ncbi:MAG: DegT/DnrJ/EryC1/StrS family aminotransferase [Desulfobacterales bacterium]
MEAVFSAGAKCWFLRIWMKPCAHPRLWRREVTERTKVRIPVHMCGSMAQIDKNPGSLCERKRPDSH